jgi:hypothetical protein
MRHLTLNNGVVMPMLGFGVFSDNRCGGVRTGQYVLDFELGDKITTDVIVRLHRSCRDLTL